MCARPSVAGHAQRLISQCRGGSRCLADRILARSDSSHFCGRAEIRSRSRSGARSARNLDVSEHAQMLLDRSERSHESSIDVNDFMTPVDLGSRDYRYRTHADRRGGATPPQGPTQAQRWVTIFNDRGRRSPSHADPLGRPQHRETSGPRNDLSRLLLSC